MPQQQPEENAQRILKALEKGDTSQAQIDSQAHFFASYLVMLGCLAARLEPDERPGECFNGTDHLKGFILKKYEWPDMVLIARHLGHCQECHRKFLQSAEELNRPSASGSGNTAVISASR